MSMPEKMLKMQMQVRENAVELNDYLRDLDMWESDVKKQDKTFAKMKPKQEKQLFAPIRNSKTTKAKKSVEAKPEENPKRIRSYDFKSWDKLDVDKMLDDIDHKEEEKEAVEYAKKQEQMEVDMNKYSEEEKKKGNDHFKASRFDKAIECYTKGMQYDPANPILPANRAMAFLRVNKYMESEADCTFSLSLDPTYVKAYLRRGSARVALGKIDSAIRDFNDVLQLEPDNRQAKSELEKIKKRNSTPKPTNGVDSHNPTKRKPGLIQPIKKPLNLQSKKPLRRIHIEEVGGEEIQDSDHKKLYESPSALKEDKMEQTRDSNVCMSSAIGSSVPQSSAQTSSLIREAELSDVSKKNQDIDKLKPDADSKDFESKLTIPLFPTLPPPPSTCYQLQADVRKLKQYPSALFQYLTLLLPSSLPSLLKDQLDTDLLLDMVAAFSSCVDGNEEFITSFLHNLTFAKRFDMAIMFLSSKNKKDLKNLFEKLSQNLSPQSFRLQELFLAYEL